LLSSSYGSEGTTENSALATWNFSKWYGLASGGLIATDGYTLLAPDVRGPIDRPSNVHAPTGLVEVERKFNSGGHFFLRGSTLDESRHNGTPDQFNGIHLWRYAAGIQWKNLDGRLFGDSEHYHQTFSSVSADRTSERLLRYVFNPSNELGAAVRWTQTIGPKALLVAGSDTHDIRASDDETLYTGSGGFLNTSDRQRQTGVFGEGIWTPTSWTVIASARVDHFSNFDAVQTQSSNAPAHLPAFSETVVNPRIGLTRRLTPSLALNASAFRAYRAPSVNELYRTSQVGQNVTRPNPNLRSERATGWETGFQTDMSRYGSSLRVSYFWTRVDRPITALTLSSTPTQTILERENLGRIESRGISLDFAAIPASWISLEGGYQFADATVTQYAQQPGLVGKWIPQVAHNMATAQVRFTRQRWGLLSLQAANSGHQFDDDQNNFLLHGYFRLDAYAAHDFPHGWQIFTAAENLFDRSIEVGKTPLPTLGTPRTVRVGLRLNIGG
jgi:outer membrane receptor protein involved in Fe transport